jgi:hypothetical protein
MKYKMSLVSKTPLAILSKWAFIPICSTIRIMAPVGNRVAKLSKPYNITKHSTIPIINATIWFSDKVEAYSPMAV